MSIAAFSLLQRFKVEARKIRQAAQQNPDLQTTYLNTGVSAEVAALAFPATLVPDCGNVTKQQYQDLVAVFTELDNYWNNAPVVSQDNEAFVQVIFEGSL